MGKRLLDLFKDPKMLLLIGAIGAYLFHALADPILNKIDANVAAVAFNSAALSKIQKGENATDIKQNQRLDLIDQRLTQLEAHHQLNAFQIKTNHEETIKRFDIYTQEIKANARQKETRQDAQKKYNDLQAQMRYNYQELNTNIRTLRTNMIYMCSSFGKSYEN